MISPHNAAAPASTGSSAACGGRTEAARSGRGGPVPPLRAALTDLLGYCRRQQWSGWDPYDGLNSRVFACIPFFRNRPARLAFIQAMKRSPLNLRSWLGVPQTQNPKGIAVFTSALVKLHRLGMAHREEVAALAARLLELRTPGQPHAGWGYDFDWQTRTYLVPKRTPNIICTTFAGHALLDAYEVLGDEACLEAARSAGRFLVEGLHLTRRGAAVCFSYTPLDRSQIHNANLLGAAFLARLHSYRAPDEFRSTAQAAAQFTLDLQRPDGSWPYGEGPNQGWIDSFHTGYNLVALERLRLHLGLDALEPAVSRGYRFFLDHFFEANGATRYYHDRTYPIDAHAVAQALITLTALAAYDPGSLDKAGQALHWALQHLRSPEGWFYYQRWPRWTNRIPYMRWAQAWMLLGMACLAERRRQPGPTLGELGRP